MRVIEKVFEIYDLRRIFGAGDDSLVVAPTLCVS